MKILLIGAAGNLGKAIIRVANFEIIQLNRGEWGDIDNLMSSGIDLVIHAASDLKNKISHHPTSIVDSNIRTTTNVIESMKRCGVSRIFYISSCAVYGKNSDSDETVKELPLTINGITKLLNERIIEDFCGSNNIDYKILRIFNLYGGFDGFSILSHIKKSLSENALFNLNNGGIAQRDFIHVDDAANIISKLANTDFGFNHINLGTGVATRVGDIVNLITSYIPQLKILHTALPEVEYSRANIDRLLKIANHQFIRIEDYIENIYIPDLKEKLLIGSQ